MAGRREKKPSWTMPEVWFSFLVGIAVVVIGIISAAQGKLVGGAVIAAGLAVCGLALWRFDPEVAKEPNGSVTRRPTISARVRNEVWHRDQGRCVECGSRERLEYDHIIPVSRGGSNTVRNLELRCEPCNRRKGAKI